MIGTVQNTAADVKLARNENGDTFTVAKADGADLTFDTTVDTTTPFATPSLTADQARGMLSGDAAAAGSNKLFDDVEKKVNDALSKFGGASNYMKGQIEFNKSKLDAMEGGLGALVDADLAKESAKLQALQIRQQLGTQSLGIANQSPQSLLSLFR